MTNYTELIERLRSRHADLMSRVIGSDQGPTVFSEAADALARLTAVPADAETTQEEREEWKIKSDVQFALWKEGVAPTLVDKTVWSFIPRLLRDLARAEARVVELMADRGALQNMADEQCGRYVAERDAVLRDLARLTAVPADAETTAEDRAQLQHDLETRGEHTNREAIKAILRDLARAEARAAVLEEARKLGNISNALWVDAEKEIEELKTEVSDLASRALPAGEGEYVCFTRGRFNEMVKEQTALLARAAVLTGQRDWALKEALRQERRAEARVAPQRGTQDMTYYAGLIDKFHRAVDGDDWSVLEDADLVEAADALAFTRDRFNEMVKEQTALLARIAVLTGERDAKQELIDHLSKENDAYLARAEAAEKALAEVRNMAMGDALGRTQRIIQFIEQFQARSQQ